MDRLEALRKVVDSFKIVKGMKPGTPFWVAWDKTQYGRNAKAAISLLDCYLALGLDLEEAAKRATAYVIFRGNEWKEAGITWTLETVAKHAWQDGMEAFDGQQSTEMEPDNLLGHGGGKELARDGDSNVEPGPWVGKESDWPETSAVGNGFFHASRRHGSQIQPSTILGRANANGVAGPKVAGFQPSNLPGLEKNPIQVGSKDSGKSGR